MEKKLERISELDILNAQEMQIVTGGLLLGADSSSTKKDVDTSSGDSYSDDESMSTDSYKRDSCD